MVLLLVVRFLAELGMLACLTLAGWRLGDSTWVSVLLAGALPLAAASVWGSWVAPRASRRLADPARLTVEIALFAGAVATLLATGPGPAPVGFGAAVVLAFLVSIPARGHEPTPR